ncbi:LOW QUALITY PROTEIN: hypothetical protein HID58_004531 [Brassica napus]|uniref:Uncharacterized protein n=1 Tax=Brassica napus TaxID=3708 RepID=A0ABQ8E610_BRANA|nr:LOW QUALITY PROTEIN: hypothetical protein HID58_004531 [Brassica napus]
MDRSSKEEDDSELKTVFECVSVAFPAWSDSKEIVTLNCDVNIQSAPRKLVETNPAVSSGPKRTAPQDSKMVIDMDKHLHRIGGRSLLKKEANDDNDGPGEPTDERRCERNDVRTAELSPVWGGAPVPSSGPVDTRSRAVEEDSFNKRLWLVRGGFGGRSDRSVATNDSLPKMGLIIAGGKLGGNPPRTVGSGDTKPVNEQPNAVTFDDNHFPRRNVDRSYSGGQRNYKHRVNKQGVEQPRVREARRRRFEIPPASRNDAFRVVSILVSERTRANSQENSISER